MATTSGNTITLAATETHYTLTGSDEYNIYGNNLANIITGNDALNRIYGGDGNDSLTGGGGNDSLHGADGGDTLVGGTGDDLLAGGNGSDAYVVDSVGDIVLEEADQGTQDVVYTSEINYTLSSHVEYLTFTGEKSLVGYGNELNNRLIGNSGDNLLSGGAGNDALYGGLGNDTLIGGDGDDVLSANESENELRGGAGNDTYYITLGLDTIIEEADQGVDTVVQQSSLTLPENFENLTLISNTNAIGRGNALRNTLIGNDGNNQLFGEDGDDSLDGRAGSNTLEGGQGNDIYTIRTLNDRIVEKAGEGNDTVWLAQSLGNYTLTDTLENLRMYTGGAGNEVILGNNVKNYMTVDTVNSVNGLGGDDTIIASYAVSASGGDGNDSVTGDHVSELNGNAGHDYLLLKNSQATVMGGDGNDTLTLDHSVGSYAAGGQGNDLYVVDAASLIFGGAGLYLVENANEGTDTIKSEVSFSLTYNDTASGAQGFVYGNAAAAHFEALTLTGSDDINGFGNAVNNNVFGNSGNNLLEGRDGHDFLVSYGGNDTLLGGNGNDTLMANGNQAAGVTLNQSGTIQMTGNAGNDTFWMVRGYVGDHSTGTNQLTITDFTHGVDRVLFSINTTSTAPTALNTLTAGTGDTLTSLMNQAAAASASTSAPAVSSFVYSGNTYLVFDQSSDATFNAAADLAVQITGTPTLTFSDLSFLKVA